MRTLQHLIYSWEIPVTVQLHANYIRRSFLNRISCISWGDRVRAHWKRLFCILLFQWLHRPISCPEIQWNKCSLHEQWFPLLFIGDLLLMFSLFPSLFTGDLLSFNLFLLLFTSDLLVLIPWLCYLLVIFSLFSIGCHCYLLVIDSWFWICKFIY